MHLKTLVSFFVVVLMGVTFTGLFLPRPALRSAYALAATVPDLLATTA